MLNNVCILGILWGKSELHATKKGGHVMSFIIALPNKLLYDKKRTQTFVNCIAFGKVAQKVSEYGEKGVFTQVVGFLQDQVLTGRENNYSNVKLSVIATTVTFYKDFASSSDIETVVDMPNEDLIDFDLM